MFPDIQFNGELRPSQADVVNIARKQLEAGERKLHIVAPPGSGKTVTGLYLWAEIIKQPTLVLCPNSAIQSQWAARTDLFSSNGAPLRKHWVSTDPEYPGHLTSLTYQSVTLPSRDDNTLDMMAVFDWVDHLIEKGQAQDPAEAQVWIESLETQNPEYYRDRLSFFRKKVRVGQRVATSPNPCHTVKSGPNYILLKNHKKRRTPSGVRRVDWIEGLNRFFAALARTDSDSLFDWLNKDFAISNLAGSRRLGDCCDGVIHRPVRHYGFDFHLR